MRRSEKIQLVHENVMLAVELNDLGLLVNKKTLPKGTIKMESCKLGVQFSYISTMSLTLTKFSSFSQAL